MASQSNILQSVLETENHSPLPKLPECELWPGKTAKTTKAVIPRRVQLNEVEQKEVLSTENGLTVKHIKAYAGILKEQFPDFLIEIQESKEEITSNSNQRSQLPCANIHINKGHGTLSICTEGNIVYYTDSMVSGDIETRVKVMTDDKQLIQQFINAYYISKIEPFQIRHLNVQQQKPRSKDCAVFVFAFLVQVLHDKDVKNLENITFKYDEMRLHLFTCYKNCVFAPFPQDTV